MKKVLFLVLILVLAASAVYSEGIDIGSFPAGQWLDAEWDAVWEFSAGNIRILDLQGGVIYDFADKTVNNLSIMPDTDGLVISFRCVETGKQYKFVKPINNPDLILVIDTSSGTHYETKLPFQN